MRRSYVWVQRARDNIYYGYNGRDKSGPYPTRNRVPSGYELRDGHDMIYSINIVETGDVFCPFYNQWRVVQI